MTTEIPRFDPEPGPDPMPGLACARGRLPLRSVAIRAEVVGATATVDVVQVFENPYDEAVEVSYVFPLPELAAVTRCELAAGGRTIAARLRERGEARQAYAEAIEHGKRAALAEEERQGVFTVTLGNLAPRERATVRFGMAYPLPREDGRLALRFPLVVAERYVPGTPLDGLLVGHGTSADTTSVRDASRITPPRLAPGAERPELTIEVAIVHGELGLHDLDASLRAIATTTEAGTTTVRLAGDGAALDRDFVLRFRLGDDVVRTQLCLAPDAGDRGGTFQLTLVPPASPIRPKPRDVVLLLDRSGSMDGWKIVAARRALARMLEALDVDDRFAAYAFGSVTVACADLELDRLHAATARARARAIDFVTGLSADGGTEMLQPLELATELLAEDHPERERWLVLVTDGQVANEDELVALVSRSAGVKVLALGVDDAVNAALLGRLARATGGRVELVQDRGELEDALDRLHLLLASPAVERVMIAGERGLEVEPGTLVPPGPLHAFPGVPLVIRGRYLGDAGALRITGRRAREPFGVTVTGDRRGADGLRACWAREQLLALEDQLVTDRHDRNALHERIVETSLRFGVLCRFTAFVAIDDARPNVTIAERHVQQPVEPTLPVVEPPPIAPRSTMPVSRFGSGVAASRNTRTMSGTLRGKYAYLSPEQARGNPVDGRHEVYMLAVLLWELVMGRRLWARTRDFEILQAIVQGELPSPLVPNELARLDPVLRRALTTNVADRYPSPLEFARALEALPLSRATPDEIAAWLRDAAAEILAEDDARAAKIARVAVPHGGYATVARLAITSEASLLLAARAGAAGNEAVVLRRANPAVAADPERVEDFLSEATVPGAGFVRTFEAGTDTLGGVFLAQDYIPGCSLHDLQRALHRANRRAPIEIALGLIVQAARALDAVLELPDPSGAVIGILLREMDPSSLRIGLDGRPVWTSLGRAPSQQLTAPRRTHVPLRVMPGVLDPSAPAAPAPPIAIATGRWVVVPRRTRAARVSASRVGRWLRRAGEFWKPR